MMRATTLSTVLLLAVSLLASCASDSATRKNAASSEAQPFTMHAPANLAWKTAPPPFPPGAQIVHLDGDPAKAGPFVFRLKFPDGYTIQPHTHGGAERITVIEGTFHIAEGDRVDKTPGKAKVATAPSFVYLPAGMKHYAWFTGESIIQLHGTGPWTLTYVNPADDPRKTAPK